MPLTNTELDLLRRGLDAWDTMPARAHISMHQALSGLEKRRLVKVSRRKTTSQDIEEKVIITWTTTEEGRRLMREVTADAGNCAVQAFAPGC